MKRLSAAVVGALLAAAMFVSPASAIPGCDNDLVIIIYENSNYGGDFKCFTSSRGGDINIPNLGNINHDQAGQCESGAPRFGDHWNDCVSSVKFYVDNDTNNNCGAYFFIHQNYGTQFDYIPYGPGWKGIPNFSINENDIMTSFRTGGNGC